MPPMQQSYWCVDTASQLDGKPHPRAWKPGASSGLLSGPHVPCAQDLPGLIELDALSESPVCADGVYPIYRTELLATAASPESSSYSLRIGVYTAYMPLGMSTPVSMSRGVQCPEGLRDATGIFRLPLSALCIGGNYPLFTTEEAAVGASLDGIAHSASFGQYTFFMSGAGSAMTADEACPNGQVDVSAAREGRISASPPAPPMGDGGGLNPSGVAAIVIFSVMILAAIVAVYTHWEQKSARRRAEGVSLSLDDKTTSQGPSTRDSQVYT
jgi:hypothetical protein